MHSQNINAVRSTIDAWNIGDIQELVGNCAEDVTYSSPLVQNQFPSKWVQGPEELSTHLAAMQDIIKKLEVVDILVGAGFYTVILRNGRRLMSVLIEPDDHNKARRIIVCHSPDILDGGTHG